MYQVREQWWNWQNAYLGLRCYRLAFIIYFLNGKIIYVIPWNFPDISFLFGEYSVEMSTNSVSLSLFSFDKIKWKWRFWNTANEVWVFAVSLSIKFDLGSFWKILSFSNISVFFFAKKVSGPTIDILSKLCTEKYDGSSHLYFPYFLFLSFFFSPKIQSEEKLISFLLTNTYFLTGFFLLLN